jgi:hypothetical protein
MSAVHATELQVGTKGLVLPNGLRIASVTFLMPRPVVQISPFVLKEGTILDVSAVIEAADLEAYLNRKQPSGATDFKVTTEGGELVVTALAHMMLAVQVGAKGAFSYSAGKLDFVPTRAEIGGVKMPDGMMKEQLAKLNPIIDIRGYPVDATVKSIEIADGMIKLAASLIVTAPIPRREP